MSDYDLVDIDRVGPSRAETIADAGFDTVDSVASTDIEAFVEETEITEGTAETIIESAAALVGDDEDTPEDDEEEVETHEEAPGVYTDDDEQEVEEVEEENWIDVDISDSVGVDEANSGEYLIPIEMETQVLMHVIHITLEEATKKHQSMTTDARDDAYLVSRKLMALVSDPSESVDETISVSKNELNALYRAISQGTGDYARRSGIQNIWSEFEIFKNVIDEARQEITAE